MKFSQSEVKDLAFAGFMLSLAFAVLMSGGLQIITNFNSNILLIFIIAFFTAGAGFLLHELMHKYTAQKYGLRAEFEAFYPMLWLALAFSFFGFIFAAPGAVFIYGFMNREKNGKVSLAGPATNITLAVIFLILLLSFVNAGLFLAVLFKYGLYINSLLAAFNMIPVIPFDGAKILAWSKTAYFACLGIALGLFTMSFSI